MDKDSKGKLLAASVPLFASQGFAAVSIRQVAEAAGVNSALISYYFGGKSGLYEAVLKEQFSYIVDRIRMLSEQPLTPVDKIRGYARAVEDVHQAEPYLIRLWFREMAEPGSPFRHIIIEHIGIAAAFLRGAITEGMSKGMFRADIIPEYAVVGLAGMLNFFFAAKPAVPPELVPEVLLRNVRYVDTMAEMFIHALEQPKERDGK